MANIPNELVTTFTVRTRHVFDWSAFDLNIDQIPNLKTDRHARLLYGLVGWLRPQTIVEVGAWNGFCTAWMARALIENGDGGVLWAIDDYSLGNQATALHNNLAQVGVSDAVRFSPGKSREAQWPSQVDFAFIDGDHSTEGCLRDIYDAMELGAKCIVVHDTYSWWGPRAIAEKEEGAANPWGDSWMSIEGMFDEGLLVMVKKEPRPPVAYSQQEYPKGTV